MKPYKLILAVLVSLLFGEYANAQSDLVNKPLYLVKSEILKRYPYLSLTGCDEKVCEYWSSSSHNNKVQTVLVRYRDEIVTSIALTMKLSELGGIVNSLMELPQCCDKFPGRLCWIGADKIFLINTNTEDFTFIILAKND